jgi:hypothetical protein
VGPAERHDLLAAFERQSESSELRPDMSCGSLLPPNRGAAVASTVGTVRLGATKGLRAIYIVSAITFTGIHQVSGNSFGATAPDAVLGTEAITERPGARALSGTALEAETGSVSGPVSGMSLAKAEIDDCYYYGRREAARQVPTMRYASDEASNPAPVTQEFRYLAYYVWSELPPPDKPADIVLSSLKGTPIGTPEEEIKRVSGVFGLDSNFMLAVAKIESGFDPKLRTGSYVGLFQLSKYEFGKFGSGQILGPRDNAIAAAYKIITEGILFEWVTHRKPTLSDLYLIHQQGWEGAAEHISQPDRIAWKSMCSTAEGAEKGEKWCKLAIWGNTLPAVKHTWKSVDKLTSGAFVEMWRGRVAQFYSEYTASAAERENQENSIEWLAGAAAARRRSGRVPPESVVPQLPAQDRKCL